MKFIGITPALIKSFESVGYKKLSPNTLVSYKSLGITPEFIKGFEVTEPLYNSMVNFAEGDSINLKNLSAKDKQFLAERLKSLFARQIWRTEGFYEVNNSNDLTVKKGLEELNK